MAKKNKKQESDNMIQVWAYSHDSSNDSRVRRAAGKEDFGSGFGPEGRDISFFAQNENHAMRMKDRILKVAGIYKVEVHYPEQEGYSTFRKGNANKSTWHSYRKN